MENWFNPLKTFYSQRKKHCYKKGAAVKVFLDETSNEEKFELLDHIFICPDCNAEFEELRGIWVKGKDILTELDKIKFTKRNTNQIKKIAAMEIKRLKSRKRAKMGPFFHPKKTFAIASGIIIIVLITLFFQSRGPGRIDMEREINTGSFEVIEPWDEIHNTFVLFRWTPIKEAKDYTLEILDSGLETFYLLEQIKSESFMLPEEVFIRLTKEEIYFWKVIANLENDKKIESEFGKFYINND